MHKEKRAEEIVESIRIVLLRDWDPLGVQEIPEAQDEYDSYVGGLYGILSRSASADDVARYLLHIETDSMGLNSTAIESLRPVAEKLLTLNIKL